MNIKFTATVVLEVNQKDNGKVSAKSVDTTMIFDDKLDENQYYKDENVLNIAGSRALSQTLIQGLAANIHTAHLQETIDSAEHLRWAISQLELAFVQIVEIENK